MKQFLVSKQITTLNNASYSPDLAPWGFFLFVKLKEIIKGTHFEGVNDIETNVTAYIKSMEKKEFEECFRAWSRRMAKCVKVHVECFEGDR